MKRLLVVSPHFPPTNAADMQRVRMLLPHWKDLGIETQVLAVAPKSVAAPLDPWLADGLPTDLPIDRVDGFGLTYRCIPGLGTLTNRAIGALKRGGTRLLAAAEEGDKPFDLVFFSTTQFGVHTLGPYWKSKFGIPFVMDYQDPWVNDYYEKHPEVVPPGGRSKYAVAHWLAKRTEPRVLMNCSGIISVSAAYPRQLIERYRFLNREFPVLVAPFPGDDRDLERVRRDATIEQSVFDPDDGCVHWVYVGRGGEDLHRALHAFFSALRNELRMASGGGTLPDKGYQSDQTKRDLCNLKIHFVGTSYAASGKGIQTIEPLAQEYGLRGIVVEHSDRIPYSQTLRCLLDADALIVPGSDDPGYTASKIYPYLLARKPMLAIFHEQSSVVDLARAVGGTVCIAMNDGETERSLAEKIRLAWFLDGKYRMTVPLSIDSFEPYTAKAQAKQLAKFFRTVLAKTEEFL